MFVRSVVPWLEILGGGLLAFAVAQWISRQKDDHRAAPLPPKPARKQRAPQPRPDWQATGEDARDPMRYGPALVLFSGGSAFGTAVNELAKLTTRTAYIVPISDNGGSGKEVIRVIGGPAIGDIRSKLLRLAHPRSCEDEAVINLLSHRLPCESRAEAKEELLRIVDGTHAAWEGIAEAYKQTVRAFLLHFFIAVVRRESVHELSVDVVNLATEQKPHFDFRRGCIGDYMITGARLFFGSLEAAIFWFSNLAGIPRASSVVPVINVNSKVTLGVKLRGGQEIIGQDNIAHPFVPGTSRTLMEPKSGTRSPLPDAIEQVFYVSEYGSEVLPPLNPAILPLLQSCDGVIYTMGALYTSILPGLVLRGVGAAVAALECPKILILNGCPDRETTWVAPDGATCHMMAEDIVWAICSALDQNEDIPHRARDYITHVLYLQHSVIVDEDQLQALAGLGLQPMEVPRDDRKAHHYNDRMLVKAVRSCLEGWEVHQMCEQKRRSSNASSSPPHNLTDDGVVKPILHAARHVLKVPGPFSLEHSTLCPPTMAGPASATPAEAGRS